jgi:hypothetical protein
MKILITIFIAFISVTISYAQKEEKSTSREYVRPEFDRGATYDVNSKKAKKKKSKNSLNDSFDKKVEEYEQRMKENAKKNYKIAKEMEKPQYSDPTYFGHKKKPKKRPPGKKKFCKECGMYH